MSISKSIAAALVWLKGTKYRFSRKDPLRSYAI